MYEELVKSLHCCFGFEEPAVCDCENCMMKDKREEYNYEGCCDALGVAAADAIEELNKTRWIPVMERLPECDLGAEVGNIEWISCGMIHAGCFGRGGKYRDAYFRTWTDGGEGMDAKDADYWRAVILPEPPKEERE